MDQKLRCQSCGMPLDDGFFGTDATGTDTQEYCKFCFQDGEFVQPDLKMENMIQMSIDNMKEEVGMDDAEAVTLANQYIPQLKRWKK